MDASSAVPVSTVPDKTGPDKAERVEILRAQKERFGGIKWGSAFFGWLTATGTALLLTAVVTGVASAYGLVAVAGPGQTAGQVAGNPEAIPNASIVSAFVALLVLFVAYYCGGYVAGRMARFSGAKQGVAVWVWAVAVAVAVAAIGFVAGVQFDGLATIDGLPQLPVYGAALSVVAAVAVAVALVTALAGAVLGGLAGMRFHRKVDRKSALVDHGPAQLEPDLLPGPVLVDAPAVGDGREQPQAVAPGVGRARWAGDRERRRAVPHRDPQQ